MNAAYFVTEKLLVTSYFHQFHMAVVYFPGRESEKQCDNFRNDFPGFRNVARLKCKLKALKNQKGLVLHYSTSVN